MYCDKIEQDLLDAYRAGDMTRARAGMEQLLAEQLKELVPATAAGAKERERFDGSLNHKTDTVFLQFITSRAEAEKAVFKLNKVKGDLLSLVSDTQEEKCAPRAAVRSAILAADFLKWLGRDSGLRELQHCAIRLKNRYYLTLNLEPEDAASEAMIKLLCGLPNSWAYMEKVVNNVYIDAGRKKGEQLAFTVSIDDDLDDEGGTMPAFIENMTSPRIPNRALKKSASLAAFFPVRKIKLQ